MSLCTGPNQDICKYANALRGSEATGCFDMYLLGGDVEPDTIAAYVIHNNEYHQGMTYEQLGRLIRILFARKYLYKKEYNTRNILKLTERKIDAYNHQKRLEREKQESEVEKKKNGNESEFVGSDVLDPTLFLGLPTDVGVANAHAAGESVTLKYTVVGTSNPSNQASTSARPTTPTRTPGMITRSVAKRPHQN